jgi:hypothetical protein
VIRSGSLNFSKGEISEELLARIDVPTYSAGLKRARNVIVLKYGGVTKRPGTRLVAETYDNTNPVRLLPFQFSLTQAYVLEMGHGYMRPLAFGGRLLETLLTVTAITKAVNAQVTAALHGYTVGEQVFFNNALGMTEINGLTGTVASVIDVNNFTVNIDTRTFGTFTGDSGGITRTLAPAPPPAPPPVPPPPPPPAPPPVGGGGGFTDGSSGGITGGTHTGNSWWDYP